MQLTTRTENLSSLPTLPKPSASQNSMTTTRRSAFSNDPLTMNTRPIAHTSLKQFVALFLAAFSILALAGNSLAAGSSANYAFVTNATSSLAQDLNSNTVDMTTGTTLLSGASGDESSSAVNNIGFDFYLMGVRYTQFNATTNGLVSLSSTGTTASGSTYVASGGTATTPILSAFCADLGTGTSGKTHYKVVGTAPN
jgi:hypothetical protein